MQSCNIIFIVSYLSYFLIALKKEVKKHLNCSICLGTYTDPRLLQCNHAYCQQCLIGLVQCGQQGQLILSCPQCRQITPVPASGVAGLQSDFRSNQFLAIVDEGHKDIAMTSPSMALPGEHTTNEAEAESKPKYHGESSVNRELEVSYQKVSLTTRLLATITFLSLR